MSEVEIIAMKPFNRTPQGEICEPGDVFAVSATRAEELERLGLARRTDAAGAAPTAEDKAKPAPANKLAPAPRNKRG